ncbi:MAG: methyltransferase domain-containing protein [Gammaproteobacteria bacterium]
MANATAEFLDNNQYTEAQLRKYEVVYGRHFVSPGGERKAREFVSMLDLKPGARVLDIGCGLGGSAFLMAREYGAKVHGIDLSSNMIAGAKERCEREKLGKLVTLEHGDCLQIKTKNEYAAAYSRDVFLHITDKPRLFTIIKSALTKGGRLLFTDYCWHEGEKSDAFLAYVEQRGYTLHTIDEYGKLLAKAGFTDIKSEDRTPQFLTIHQHELQRLMNNDQAPRKGTAELAQHWAAKISRIETGEQRWGLFSARKSA